MTNENINWIDNVDKFETFLKKRVLEKFGENTKINNLKKRAESPNWIGEATLYTGKKSIRYRLVVGKDCNIIEENEDEVQRMRRGTWQKGKAKAERERQHRY